MSTVLPAEPLPSTGALRQALQAALPELIALRRHLHAHPELSGNEHQTAALVAGELRGLGWRVREGVGRGRGGRGAIGAELSGLAAAGDGESADALAGVTGFALGTEFGLGTGDEFSRA